MTGPRGTVVLVVTRGLDEFHAELHSRNYPFMNPGVESAPGGGRGYGLALVAAMTSRWGAGPRDGRNVTWFELTLPTPGSPGTAS